MGLCGKTKTSLDPYVPWFGIVQDLWILLDLVRFQVLNIDENGPPD